MRVLLVHEYYRSSAPSGEDAVFRNERRLLEQSGVEVISYEVYNDNIDISTLRKRVSVGLDTIWSSTTHRRLGDLVRKERPDVAHFHNTFPLISPSAYRACEEAGVPVVQTLHNYRMVCPGGLLQRQGQPCEDCIDGSLMAALRHRCYRDSLAATIPLAGMIAINRLLGSYGRVSRYIALTAFAASRMIAGGFPAEKVVVKPNFLPNPPSPGDGDGGYAVYVGRLSPEKGLRTLLKAWRDVGFPLHVYGDGPMSDELRRDVSDRNLEVRFFGARPREEVLAAITKARLQVIPSEWYEGFPMVALEAFAAGTPLLASDIGSLSEIVEEGVTGVRFVPGDASSLRRRLLEMWGKDETRSVMRSACRQVFEKRFSADRNLETLLGIYRSVSNAARS